MDADKKKIRDTCKKASSYQAWRNPFGVWFVTLFNEKDESFLEFQYSDDFPKREKNWILDLLDEIDKRRKENGTK